MTEGPELRVFVPLAADEMPRSYLPGSVIRDEADDQARVLLEARDLAMMGGAKALRIAGDGIERGLPFAYGFLFTYRTVVKAAAS